MNSTIKYTKSDLQLSEKTLFHAISQVVKELEKKDTPRSRKLSEKLLSNFNNYDMNQLAKMLNDLQRFLIGCIKENEDTLDVEYVVEHNLTNLKKIIMFESFE